jgi:hypothetical protein
MATTMPEPEAQAAIGPVGRITGVFFSPTATFQDIARKPNWAVPMAVLILIWISLNLVMVQRADWIAVSKEQIAKSKFASRQIDQLSEDQKGPAYERAAKQAVVVRYVRGVIGWPLFLLFSAVLYFGAFRLIGGARLNFATAFSIITFAHLPMGLRELIAIPVMYLKDPASIDPENFLASNPAAVRGDLPAWQNVPLVSLDLFALWALALVAIGFSAADPKKVPIGKAFGIVGGVWGAFVLFFTMLAWIFS